MVDGELAVETAVDLRSLNDVAVDAAEGGRVVVGHFAAGRRCCVAVLEDGVLDVGNLARS